MNRIDTIKALAENWTLRSLSTPEQLSYLEKNLAPKLVYALLSGDEVIGIMALEDIKSALDSLIANCPVEDDVIQTFMVEAERDGTPVEKVQEYVNDLKLQISKIPLRYESAVNMLPGDQPLDQVSPDALFIRVTTRKWLESQVLITWADGIGLKEKLVQSGVLVDLELLRNAYVTYTMLGLMGKAASQKPAPARYGVEV